MHLPGVLVELKTLAGGEKVEGKPLENIYFVATEKAILERKESVVAFPEGFLL